jgi:arylsulfatase A-like enzyme
LDRLRILVVESWRRASLNTWMKPLSNISLLALTLIFFCAELFAQEPPNVILLMGDDHGWDEVAYNGHPYLHTPVLDEMASVGLRLDRFHTASPVCSPTRGSVMTGRHPNRYGTFTPNWSIRPEEITIGHIMKKAGYQTGHFGKWHLGPVKADSPTNPGAMGFDEWLSHDNFFELDPVLVRNGGAPKKYPGESSEIVIDETIRFAEDAEKNNKPFLAVVWFGSPHEPYMALDEDRALYANLPQKYAEETVSLTSIETGQSSEQSLRAVMMERYAEITAMDRAIGKLRDYLKKANLRDNTIVWYCGDNGVPSSGNATNPLRKLKGFVYDGGVRVPGLIEWPKGIPEPRNSNTNTVTSDILPTLCDLTGQPLPNRPVDGISLKPLLLDDMAQRPSPVFFWNYDARTETSVEREPYIDPQLQEGTTPLVKMMDGKYTRSFTNFHHPVIEETNYAGPKAVLASRYKLVIDGERSASRELFDIRNDPYETTNLIEDLPAIATTLENQLLEWQHSVLKSLTGADY